MKIPSNKYARYPYFFLIFLLSCSAYAEDLFKRHEPVSFTKFQKLMPGQTIGGYPILNLGSDLFIGDLKGDQAGGGDSPLPIGLAALFDIRDNRFVARVVVQANLAENGRAIDWRDEPCKKDEFLWKRSIGGNFTNINCVTIAPQTQFLPEYPTVLTVVFTRYSTSARRLTYVVSVNPEFFQVARDAEPDPKANGWHKSAYENDPQKARFIAGLAKWATDVQDRMDKAFDKNTEAFSDMPLLDSYFANEKTAALAGGAG